MDKTVFKELLDNIYEMEGLVCLALNRNDIDRNLLNLLRKKGETLAEMCKNAVEKNAETLESTQNIEFPINDESYFGEYTLTEDPEEELDQMNLGVMPMEEKKQEEKEEDGKAMAELTATEKGMPVETKGKLVFSLNDRYRFKRMLFSDSDIDFNNTLAIIASMENYDEAEDYFLNELEMDESDHDVADFLNIIKNYFGE